MWETQLISKIQSILEIQLIFGIELISEVQLIRGGYLVIWGGEITPATIFGAFHSIHSATIVNSLKISLATIAKAFLKVDILE